jgi:hypothetical protein
MPDAEAALAALMYEVRASDGARELSVDVVSEPFVSDEIGVAPGAEDFVEDLQVARSGGWSPVDRVGRTWRAPECASGCRLRYRFALDAAARNKRDADLADRGDGWIQAPPATWLVQPTRPRASSRSRVHVTPPLGLSFVSGLLPSPDGARSTYEADTAALAEGPYSSFGAYYTLSTREEGMLIAIAPGERVASDSELDAWARDAGRAVAAFYGRFPVERVVVIIRPVDGARIRDAESSGGGGAAIVVDLGRDVSPRDLRTDWKLTHELAHTALPNLSREHHWLEEGLAVYVEQVARARAGLWSAEDAWKEFAHGLPQGVRSRSPLDSTSDWGSTYWGGALFCLLADIRIRERTHGAHTLDDGLRAIVASGGNIMTQWPIERVLRTADAATGTAVLAELYREMGRSPRRVDVALLLADLGVAIEGDRVIFHDDAPHAAIRRAITLPEHER